MNTPNKTEIPLFDLYDLWYEPLWHKAWFWWLVGCLLALFVFLLIFFIIKKIKARRSKIQKEPWQKALEQLQDLALQKYEDPACHALFYADLTHILKTYLRYRYDLPLESKTDQETILVLRESDFPQEFFDELAEIFQGALYIKFAHQYAALQRMKGDLARSIEIVKSTGKPRL